MPRALALLLLSSTAMAGNVTIAVMPFKDLSGSQSAVGEAIRETVTTDLHDLAGVKVIERGNLDKILAEQHLQAQRSDLDPATAAKVGKLLGATIICGGAYQKVPPMVRLTARFISVETGQILDTAKVDGNEHEFLKLQDKVTAQLLKHAKLGGHAQKIEQRSRPPVNGGLKTLEHYGQALLADSDDQKLKFLKLALADDANFSYAANDLAALEKRMQVYQANADVARDKVAREALAKMQSETDPNKYLMLTTQVFTGLMQSRRFHAMEQVARAILKSPPKLGPSQYPGMVDPLEITTFYLITAENSLGEEDALLRDGEKFLREHPASMYFTSIKGYMDQVINEKKKVEEGKAGLAAKLAEVDKDPTFKDDPCKRGFVYSEQSQYKPAQQHFLKCLDKGSRWFTPSAVLPLLIQMDLKVHDWAGARRDIERYQQIDAATYRSMKAAYDMQIPAD